MNGQDNDPPKSGLCTTSGPVDDTAHSRPGSGVVNLLEERAARRGRGDRQSIVIGGGGGGVGRTLLAANLALYLGRQGRRVTAVDLDASGPALHTRLGIPIAVPTPALRVRPTAVREERLSGTQLSLVGPNRVFAGEAQAGLQRSILDAAHRSAADILVIDIGRGATELAIDTYLDADIAITVVLPEPSAIEQAYAFLRTALVRAFIEAPTSAAHIVRQLLSTAKGEAMPTFSALFDYVQRTEPDAWEAVREARADFSPSLVMNRCQNRADRDMIRGMTDGLHMRWGIDAEPLGTLDEDEVAHQAARWRRPLLTTYPSSVISAGIERIGSQVLSTMGQRAGPS